jgi:hypothetical protein
LSQSSSTASTRRLRAEQVAAELQVVGRIGEDHVDARGGKPCHGRDAILFEDLAERQVGRRRFRLGPAGAGTHTRQYTHSSPPPGSS